MYFSFLQLLNLCNNLPISESNGALLSKSKMLLSLTKGVFDYVSSIHSAATLTARTIQGEPHALTKAEPTRELWYR